MGKTWEQGYSSLSLSPLPPPLPSSSPSPSPPSLSLSPLPLSLPPPPPLLPCNLLERDVIQWKQYVIQQYWQRTRKTSKGHQFSCFKFLTGDHPTQALISSIQKVPPYTVLNTYAFLLRYETPQLYRWKQYPTLSSFFRGYCAQF